MKKIFKIALIIFVCFLVLAGGFLFYLSRGLNEGLKVTINEVDLSQIDDGLYIGVYDRGRWGNEIEVEIKDNNIIQLSIREDQTFSRQSVVDQLFGRVIETQKINVDTVSEATVSSKAYLKAIENALNS